MRSDQKCQRGRTDAIATERTRIAESVVVKLEAELRGDGQGALDLWAKAPDA